MKHLQSQKGQITVEAVLLLAILISGFTVTHREIKRRQLLTQIVSGPWSIMSGMIENGVWMSAETSKPYHPNVFGRRASPEPQ